MVKRKGKELIDDFYLMALHDLADGASIGDLKRAMKYYETLEDYEACAGIKKALDEIKTETIQSIKTKIDEIRRDKRSS